MVAIVSILYQDSRAAWATALRSAGRSARPSLWLKGQGYTNVIIEVANEHTVDAFRRRAADVEPDAVTGLIEIAREPREALPSDAARRRRANREVAESSDVVLVHGNGSHKQRYYTV